MASSDSLAVQVLQHLTSRIESGDFARGSFLPAERALATQLGVSRVVVREAAKRLEEQGLVRIRQGRGVLVLNDPALPMQQLIARHVPLSKDQLYQGAQARLLVEPELAALAAQNATPSQVEALYSMPNLLMPGSNLEQAVKRDIDFHNAIADLSGNRVLGLMLHSIAEIGRESRQITLKNVGVRKAHEQHVVILDAIASGSPAEARNAMKKHLQAAIEDLD